LMCRCPLLSAFTHQGLIEGSGRQQTSLHSSGAETLVGIIRLSLVCCAEQGAFERGINVQVTFLPLFFSRWHCCSWTSGTENSTLRSRTLHGRRWCCCAGTTTRTHSRGRDPSGFVRGNRGSLPCGNQAVGLQSARQMTSKAVVNRRALKRCA